MRGTKQGGSVLNFIIVAVVLVGLVVGGVYVLRQQMTTTQSQEELLPEEPVVVDEEQSEPVEEEGQSGELAQELPGVATEQLPQTGPVESMAMALALGMLSLATVSYIQSRRAVTSL